MIWAETPTNPLLNIVDIEDLNGIIATDQTGRLPIISQQGNQYMMVL